MKRNKLFVVGALVAMALSLGAWGNDEGLTSTSSNSTKSSKTSTATIPTSGKYDLIYQDQQASGDAYNDDDYVPRDIIGIVVNGKSKEYRISANRVYEKVALKYANKPYVIINDGEIVIYRGPYQQYIQPAADGTVTSK